MSKITHVSPYYPPHYGGVEKHVEEISKLLISKGNDVGIVTLQHDKKLKQTDELKKVKIFRIPIETDEEKAILNKFKYKLKIWKWVWRNKKIFSGSDIIYVHDVFWWMLPIWPLIRKKVFITFHGWEGMYPVPVKNKLQRLIWSRLSKASIHVGGYIEEFYWDRADEVMYGGVKPHPSRFAKQNLSPSPSSGEGYKEKLSLVFVGRLEKVNEIETYIKIIKELKDNNFKIDMVWMGDGSLRKKCEKVGKVLGFVKDQDKYLANADLVFASSYLSILEAQSMGKLVVAIYSNKLKQSYLENYPGSKYMIVKDASCEIEKLISLLKDNKKLLKMKKAAKKFASKMTWKKVLGTYEKLWKASRLRSR